VERTARVLVILVKHETQMVTGSRGDPARSVNGVPTIRNGGGSAGDGEGLQGGGCA
jgi:hypothetical protein